MGKCHLFVLSPFILYFLKIVTATNKVIDYAAVNEQAIAKLLIYTVHTALKQGSI